MQKILAPQGRLRAGINLSNFLLVSEKEPVFRGVSPSLATFVAEKLGATVDFVPYPNPGSLTKDTESFGIGLVGNEPQRAEKMVFSPAYAQIEATFLVRRNVEATIESIDSPGKVIAVSEGAAYDLFLTNNLKHATLKRAKGLDASFELFRDDSSIDALAGLRPKLIEYDPKDYTILPGQFTSVQQSIGIPRHLLKSDDDIRLAREFLTGVVTEALESGLIKDLIDEFQVTGRLSPAPF